MFPELNLQFAQFLIRDDEPLLFHTGLRAMFPIVRGAVATLIDPRRLRWVGFSHYERSRTRPSGIGEPGARSAPARCDGSGGETRGAPSASVLRM